jgi:hypothetical protein
MSFIDDVLNAYLLSVDSSRAEVGKKPQHPIQASVALCIYLASYMELQDSNPTIEKV